MPVSAAAACVNHPVRDAIGVCVPCRARVCAECATKMNGINYCVTCLAALARADDKNAKHLHVDVGPAWRWAAWCLGSGMLVLLVWAWLESALPGGGW